MKKNFLKKADLHKPVTMGLLLEYTDDFLLPKMADIIDDRLGKTEDTLNKTIDQKNAQLEFHLKEYIDNKLADYTSDIFKRLDKKHQQEKDFKQKVVEIFKKHRIGSAEEIAFLEGLVQGS